MIKNKIKEIAQKVSSFPGNVMKAGKGVGASIRAATAGENPIQRAVILAVATPIGAVAGGVKDTISRMAGKQKPRPDRKQAGPLVPGVIKSEMNRIESREKLYGKMSDKQIESYKAKNHPEK